MFNISWRPDPLLLRLHRWTGLVAGLLLALIGTTGSAIVFWEELDRLLFPADHRVEVRGAPSVGVTYAAARAALPGADVVWIEPHPGSATRVYLRREGSPHTYDELLVDPYGGEVRARRKFGDDSTPAEGLVEWVYMLHFTLTAGASGRTVVAWTSVLLLVSTATGAWAYRKKLTRAWSLRVPLRQPTAAGTLSSLHRVVGSFALATNLLLGVTGLWMLRGDLVGLAEPVEGVVPAPDVPAATVDAAIAAALAAHPALAPRGFAVGDEHGRVHVEVWGTLPDDTIWLGETASGVTVDAAGPRVVETHLGREHGLLERIDQAVYVLHFAQWGGLPVRLAYVAAGLALPLLSLSGLATWALRAARVRARRAALAGGAA